MTVSAACIRLLITMSRPLCNPYTPGDGYLGHILHISVRFTDSLITIGGYGKGMKTPCEVVVWYVLPTIRREIAKELVETYHMKQADVGRIFGVTDAAISQYLKKKRGGSAFIENSSHYGEFLEEVKRSAKLIVEEKSDMSVEMCRICSFIKTIGLLAEVYSETTGAPAPSCAWGHTPDITQIR